MRARFGVVGLVLVLLVSGLTVSVAPVPASAVVTGSLPTQWIAQQYTELLGRAPTPTEWQYWLSYYQGQSACTTTNLLAVTKYLTGTAPSPVAGTISSTSTEFAGLYPATTALDKATRLAAVVRAAAAHDPNDLDFANVMAPYVRGTTTWATVVDTAVNVPLTNQGVGAMCNPNSSSRAFGFFRPIDLRAKVMGEFPALTPALTPSRTQAQLKSALTTAASGTTVAARTVTLRQGEVIRIGGSPNGNQALVIPAGVTLTTEGLPAYVEPATGTAPKALPYARMGRIVNYTSTSATYPNPADGWTCAGYLCPNGGMVRLGVGSHLTGVWVDGQGADDRNSKVALVETKGSSAPNGATIYDDATSVIASRLSQPGRDGAGLRLRGNSAGTPCTNEKVTGNLVTAYSSLHQFDQSGQAKWADGIVVSCEQATVSSNSIVDVTDTAISVLGSFNRTQNATVTQRSQVFNNAILSAGLDTHVALGADAVGECRADRDGLMIPCIDQFVPRDMTGTNIHHNTFWTGPRTSFDIGLMVGGGTLWGDHQIPNAPGTNKGAKFDTNTTGPTGVTSARVNIGIDIHDMVNATVTANTLNTTLVDGNPRLTFNKCPLVSVAVGTQERATLTTNLSLPAATTTSRGCLIGEPPSGGPERVRINADGSGFEGTNTKRPFTVWGGDLPYPAPLTTMVDDLRDVRRMGANTVRLLIDLEDLINGPTLTVNQAALTNLGDIATAAGQMGIYLDITGIGIARHHGPVKTVDPTPYTSWYDQLGTTGDAAKKGADEKLRWQAQNLFWSTVANTLKNQNSILLYDLVNEPTFGAQPGVPTPTWCFSSVALPSSVECWNQNPVKTLADPNNPSVQRDKNAVISSWLSGMRNAIRQYDTTRPITVGGDFYALELLDPHVELTAPHAYPSASTLAERTEKTKSFKVPGKPLIVEETFTNGDSVTLEKFLADTSSVSSGYLGHFNRKTPSQLNVQLATPPANWLTIAFWLDWSAFFLRNGLSHSPAGQGIMPY